jgi:nitrite reductase/ring-hydroxylating ferredoxin subunit
MTWVKTLPVSELAELRLTPFEIEEGVVIVLVREGESVFALENRCSHDHSELDGGHVYEGMIECPRHGALFDYKTGQVKAMPAVTPIQSYPVEIRGGVVYVQI